MTKPSASNRRISPFPPDAPWDDMPDVGPRPKQRNRAVRILLRSFVVFDVGFVMGLGLGALLLWFGWSW